MRRGPAEEHVDDDHRDQDGDDVEHEREQQVLGHQRDRDRRGRQDFRHEQQKDNQGEQDADGQCHLVIIWVGTWKEWNLKATQKTESW